MFNELALLRLLQLTNSALPVGAYSYSEGIENLVEAGVIHDAQSLKHWLEQELLYGAIRLEAAIMVRGYKAFKAGDLETLDYWNNWAASARETEELREQSWQMGVALMRLLEKLEPSFPDSSLGTRKEFSRISQSSNFAIAFSIAAAQWQIELSAAVLGYLHSWATNLVSAGVRLIPLGQTTGQQLLLDIHHRVIGATKEILTLNDEQLNSCGWGLALASMEHETQYTRLFRS